MLLLICSKYYLNIVKTVDTNQMLMAQSTTTMTNSLRPRTTAKTIRPRTTAKTTLNTEREELEPWIEVNFFGKSWLKQLKYE